MKAKNNCYYIALSMNIKSKDNQSLREKLKEEIKVALQLSIKQEEVREISIYSQKKSVEKEGNFIAWNFLALIELESEGDGKGVATKLRNMDNELSIEMIRLELLVTTPESTYPVAQEKARKRRFKPFYAVEYVDVKKDNLKEFQDIMIKNNGPAMKYIMENSKWCYNFYALETVCIYYHNTGYPSWNQIHVIGLYLESVICYKKDFTKGLELAGKVSFEQNFTRLKQIRTMLYKTIGKKIL